MEEAETLMNEEAKDEDGTSQRRSEADLRGSLLNDSLSDEEIKQIEKKITQAEEELASLNDLLSKFNYGDAEFQPALDAYTSKKEMLTVLEQEWEGLMIQIEA